MCAGAMSVWEGDDAALQGPRTVDDQRGGGVQRRRLQVDDDEATASRDPSRHVSGGGHRQRRAEHKTQVSSLGLLERAVDDARRQILPKVDDGVVQLAATRPLGAQPPRRVVVHALGRVARAVVAQVLLATRATPLQVGVAVQLEQLRRVHTGATV